MMRMFPGIDGFHWTFGHVIFLSLFFAVTLTILATVISAIWRTVSDFREHRAMEFCWEANFTELPISERRCRHELAGRVISRTCNNAFDCRDCEKYSQFAVLPATGNLSSSGLSYPEDRYYHRGHTWVKASENGTVRIGLDQLAEYLIGDPDSIRMPEIGEELDLNQTAWQMRKNGKDIAVRAPIEGRVTAIGGPKEGWYLEIRPRFDPQNAMTFRHLLRGAEVRGWLSRELERLQLQLRAPDTAPALADGGVLVPDLMNAVPEADWDAVLEDTFLQV
jgi:glycine cleavage system H protein